MASTGVRDVPVRPMTGVVQGITLLNAKDTTGAGSGYGLGRAYTVFALQAYRATTGSAGASTKPSFKLQGNIAGGQSTRWYTIGAATRNPTKDPGTLSAVTSTAAITAIRAVINNFTTSASTSAPDKVKTTVIVVPVS